MLSAKKQINRARQEVARWRQKATELELRLQEAQSGEGTCVGNHRGVPSEGPRPMTVEGHEMSHNVREEMDIHAERMQLYSDAASAAADDREHDQGGLHSVLGENKGAMMVVVIS